MPELPEVETVRRQLEPALTGRTVLDAWGSSSPKFSGATEAVGSVIASVDRRGKYLLIGLGQRELIIHLGMTGILKLQQQLDEHPHRRAWWLLDDQNTLVYDDVRQFGRIRVVTTGDYSEIATLRQAGPEPFDLELTGALFHKKLKASRTVIKTRLLSQKPIAGVGNIYADEALWLAGIHPKATRIGLDRATTLLDSIRQVMTAALDNGGTTFRDYRDSAGQSGFNMPNLAVYGRAGQPCLNCERTLSRDYIDGRSTVWCASCQRH